MNRRTQKRWALLVLVVWLPLYCIAAVVAVTWAEDSWGRAPIWIEVPIYVCLALLSILPFKRVFQGIGREE